MPNQSPIEARLYTLNEAADLTGLSVDALRQRIKRRKLQAVRGNDGLVRVRLDADSVEALKNGRPPSRPSSQPPSQLAEESLAIRGLEAAIAALRDQLALGEAEKADLRGQRDRVQEMADQALADLRAERAESRLREAESAEERRRLTVRIAELEARLAERSEIPATDSELPDPDAISADLEHEGPPSPAWVEEAWGDTSNDQSPGADPAHQVERLWQRMTELEVRLEQANGERAGDQSETAAEPATAEADAAPDLSEAAPPAKRRRWWRLLRRR